VIRSCSHIRCFRAFAADNELPESEDLDDSPGSESLSDGCCLSYSPVTYRLAPQLRERYKTMITTGSVKVEGDLTPDETSMIQCKHGNAWSDLDPVAMGWIRCNQPYIYYLQWTDNSKRNGKLQKGLGLNNLS
jgi:hypothetical protein